MKLLIEKHSEVLSTGTHIPMLGSAVAPGGTSTTSTTTSCAAMRKVKSAK